MARTRVAWRRPNNNFNNRRVTAAKEMANLENVEKIVNVDLKSNFSYQKVKTLK